MSANVVTTKSHLFFCPTCKKGFTRKDYLTRHELNHNDVKPFKCDQCNLSFTRSDLLSKHFKSKSHQRVRDHITCTSLKFDNSQNNFRLDKSVLGNDKSLSKLHRFSEPDIPRSTNSIFESTFSKNVVEGPKTDQRQLVEKEEHNNEHRRKKFKRLGISSFLNHHEDKIPAPPPQPSIILPQIYIPTANSNYKNSFERNSFDNKNSQQNVQNYEGIQFPPNGFDLNTTALNDLRNESFVTGTNIQDTFNQQDNNFKSIEAPKNFQQQNQLLDERVNGGKKTRSTSCANTNVDNDDKADNFSNGGTPLVQTPDIAGGFIDNLFWLFSDVSPLTTDYQLQEPVPPAIAATTTCQSDSTTESTLNYIDIPPSMYHSLCNEIATSNTTQNTKLQINDLTRQKIVDLFPTITKLLTITVKRFNEYLDLYWFNFAQTFPIIHKATFDPNAMDVYLLIAMLIIGMAHSLDKAEYDCSIAWNKKYRTVIHNVIDDNIELPLPLIQAVLLHNFSAKNFGDMRLNQLAQVDHGLNIMYLKFSGLLNTLTEPIVYKPRNANLKELTGQWYNWLHYETCKRAVFFEFICDTQHVTFSKLELLSAFDIKLELPCTDEVWNAADPLKFFEEYQKQPRGLFLRPKLTIPLGRGYNAKDSKGTSSLEPLPRDENHNLRYDESSNIKFSKILKPAALEHDNSISTTLQSIKMISKWPSFLWSLKSMMTAFKENQREYSLDCFSLFSRYIILHGLMRICWDMRGQGLLDLGVVSKKKLNEFFKKLERAFLNWKGYFDLHMKLYDEQVKNCESSGKTSPSNTNSRKGLNSSNIFLLNNYGPSNASWANISFYYTGLFCLYADIPSITMFATEYKNFHSSANTQYKDIKEMEYERNKLIIEQWSRSLNGKLSLTEACKFLGLVYRNEEIINTFSHVPGTAYIAALMIWCFEIKRDCPNVMTILEASRGDAESYRINYDVEKYFDKYGNIKHEVAREDAVQYFGLILDLNNGEEQDYNYEQVESEGNDDKDEEESKIEEDLLAVSQHRTKKRKKTIVVDNKWEYEEFRERQLRTIGVVCYVLHLLRNCKWSYSVDLVEKLEHVVKTYER